MKTKRKMPSCCYSVLGTTNEVILIKYGESGYYNVKNKFIDTLEKAEDFVKTHNEMLGVLPEERLAMEIGSMFGWNVTGADPQCYLNKSTFVSSEIVEGDVATKGMTILYPIKGELYEYNLLNETRHFLLAENLPEYFPNVRYVEIDGKKFIPVELRKGKKIPIIMHLM